MMEHKKEQDAFKKELDKLFAATTKSSMIHKCNMHVENGSGTFMWNREYGERTIHSIMNLASVTKLFTTTCIINLIQQDKLSLTDPLDKYFESELLEDIHIYKGKDYSYEITVGNLLFQNTGFPDVFAMDKSILKELNKFAMIQYCPPLGQYGGGFVRLNISGIASMYRLKGELLGHMGGSGTYAYYYPEKDLYFVGDVNQFAKQGLIFTIPLKLAKLAYRYAN